MYGKTFHAHMRWFFRCFDIDRVEKFSVIRWKGQLTGHMVRQEKNELFVDMIKISNKTKEVQNQRQNLCPSS